MTYKKQVLILLTVTAVLGLIFAGTLILTPERLNSRDAAYTWLEPKWAEQAGRIEISGGTTEPLVLVNRNAVWYVESEGVEYPAKQGRVADMLRLLSTQGAYPLRGSAASSHERLGVGENASRIVVRGAGAAPLLDLLVGSGDATGREVYLRKSGQNEIRSGEDQFTVYLSSSATAWYNLRLFPQEGSGALSLDMVQRVTTVSPPLSEEDGGEGGLPQAPLVITRSGSGWTVEGVAADDLDTSRIDPYIRAILDAEGDGFTTSVTPEDPVFNEGRIHLELGDGAARTIRLGPALPAGEGDAGKRIAVTGSQYVYTLAEWTVNRLFRDSAYFKKPQEE
jgi:hypothetical protein